MLQSSLAEKDPDSPTLINAFQLIGMSLSLDLSGFFEIEVIIVRGRLFPGFYITTTNFTIYNKV